MIPNGTIVTYVGIWPHTERTIFVRKSADDTIAAVGDRLLQDGLPIRSEKNSAGLFTPALGTSFTVTLQLEVQNGLGFAEIQDLINVVRHEVYQIIGDFPLSDSVPFVQAPSPSGRPGEPISTGLPGGTRPTSGECIAGTNTDLSGEFSLSCWWKNLSTQGLSSIGLLALIALGGIAIFIYAGFRPRTA